MDWNMLQAEDDQNRGGQKMTALDRRFPSSYGVNLLILLSLLALPGKTLGQAKKEANDRATDRDAIRAILLAQQEAWNRGDVEAFLNGYWRSPDLTFSGTGGISRGWDGVLARYKKNYPDRNAMGQLDFSDLEFHFLGPDASLVLGHWHLKREKDDLGGVFSLVWQRFPEGWRIIHDHTSADIKQTSSE
jgi:ketosteroid isomerase-like protein